MTESVMVHADVGTYPPLNTLKPVAQDVWIVDGPLIRFGLPFWTFPFPTRMTVVRLANGDLFVHSPTPCTPALQAEIAAIGRPRYLIGPNRIHYWWIPDWHAAYPDAEVFLAPRIKAQSKGRIAFDFHLIDQAEGYPWEGEIKTLIVPGRYMSEAEFFHHASRTLILTDLIENFETQKLGSRVLRFLTWLDGLRDPDGQMPRDLRLTFDKITLRGAVEAMIALAPERVIIAHGRWYDANGTEELKRAFRWLLDKPAGAAQQTPGPASD